MLKIKSIKFVNDPVFKNKMFDFTTRSNDVASTVIIVGENGSGKTRLINILKQLTDFIFVNDKKHFLYNDNNTRFTKQEIEHNNDFYLNAWEYEIEYEYTTTPNEKKLFESEYWIPSSNLKDEFNEINSKLGNKVYFILHISTSFKNKNIQDNNYDIIINNVYLLYEQINKQEYTQLNEKISAKLMYPVISNVMVSTPSWDNTNFIFGLLVKGFKYTYYFDTLQELSKSNEKNNQSYEEFLLNVYKEEFNIENIEYNFSKLDINLFKLNNYARAINHFLKNFPNKPNKNENYLELDKITKNKIHFKKDNNNIYYEELSTGEKKLLSESIFWFKLFFQKHTNSENNYVDKLNIIHQINMIYFIDEIELSFHPRWTSKILNFLKECLKDAYGQIFITTHSEIIPYSINIKTDTLINMNDDNEIISFKNYNSIQDFVNDSLYVDYEDFIDEYDIWVEGRSDKVLLNTAIKELNEKGSKTTISFNIRFANNFNKKIKDSMDIMNGAVGVRTQFLSWLSKNDKKNNSVKEIKPKCFIFDNDCVGQEKYDSIISILNQKDILNRIKIEFNKIIDNKIFNGFEVRRQREGFKREGFKEEKAFILIYKNKEEIEDFIEDEEIRKNCKKNKGNIEEIIKNNNDWKQEIANSFEEYIKTLQEILSNK